VYFKGKGEEDTTESIKGNEWKEPLEKRAKEPGKKC